MMKINDIQKVYKKVIKSRIAYDAAIGYISDSHNWNNVVTITAMAKRIVSCSRVVDKVNKAAGQPIPAYAWDTLESFVMWVLSNNINMNADEADDDEEATAE